MGECYEFDEVTLLSAFAVGVPGKRTFFLVIGENDKWVRAWLEKEQLEALSLAIDQYLFTLSRKLPHFSGIEEKMTLKEDVPPGLPSAELEIEQIALDYGREEAVLDFVVHTMGPQNPGESELHCHATLTQLKRLGDQAKNICAAGRPRCILCGNPIGPEGHICPKNN